MGQVRHSPMPPRARAAAHAYTLRLALERVRGGILLISGGSAAIGSQLGVPGVRGDHSHHGLRLPMDGGLVLDRGHPDQQVLRVRNTQPCPPPAAAAAATNAAVRCRCAAAWCRWARSQPWSQLPSERSRLSTVGRR